MAKHWYVVHTYSGFENKAKAALEDGIKRSGLTDRFGEVLVPTEKVVEVKEEVVAVKEPVLDNGWPVECEAEIWGPCINDSLVVVKLDDGRRVSLKKIHGLPYRTQDRVSIRLFKSTGDPLYVELPRAKTAF